MPVRFKTNPDKALEAIVWLANNKPGITAFVLSKLLFFADKIHLERYGRPIIGDRYIAMEHGPVPSRVYDLVKFEEFLDEDTLQSAMDAFEVARVPYPSITAKRKPDEHVFSETDLECLTEALGTYGSLSMSRLRKISHSNPAYQAAQVNGEMDYALIIDENLENREQLIEELREVASHMVI